jgi:sugar-phosphatase
VAVASVDATGRIAGWSVHQVGWGDLHGSGGEGSHHARIVRFLREHQVGCVVVEHMGLGMQRVMTAMRIPVFTGAAGPARDCVERAAAILAGETNAAGGHAGPGQGDGPNCDDAVRNDRGGDSDDREGAVGRHEDVDGPDGDRTPGPGAAGLGRVEIGALLVDMDGTVVDSSAAVRQVWTEYAAAHGLDAAEVVGFAHGRRPVETVVRFDPGDPDPQATAQKLQAQEMSLTEGVTEVRGGGDLWRGIGHGGGVGPEPGAPAKLALVTSASRPLAEVRMAAAGLAMPAVAICAEDVADGKPSPDGYLAAARALGVPIGDCLILEDSPAGIEAALASGASVIVVAGGAPAPADPRILAVVADLSELSVRPLASGRLEVRRRPGDNATQGTAS